MRLLRRVDRDLPPVDRPSLIRALIPVVIRFPKPISLRELKIAVSGIDISDQMSEVQDRPELKEIRLSGRASDLLERDIRRKTISKRSMDKFSSSRLRTTISWISRMDGGQHITYRN